MPDSILQDVNIPAAGAVLASVLSGTARVTVYSDAGLTTPVTLPAAIPAGGSLVVYVPAGPWDATITATTGGAFLGRVSSRGADVTALTLLAAGETALLERYSVDGGTP